MWPVLWLLVAERDWLSADFERELAAKAKAACGQEFRVRLGKGSPVKAIRALVGGEDGKEIYVQFLKDRYAYAIEQVNKVYGRDATSFTELLTDGFRGVDESRREVTDDDAAFASVLQARWQAALERGARQCGARTAPVVAGVDQELVVRWRPKRDGPA